MALKKLELLIVVMIQISSSLFLSSCSKGEVDLIEEARLKSSDLNSPGALQAAGRLSAEQRQLLGTWQLSVEGGNSLFHDLPEEVLLLPYADPPSRRQKYFVLKPDLPEEHLFCGDTYWTLNDKGELVLWWIKFSGLRATLQPISENRWEGVIEEVWDYQRECVRKRLVLEKR